ncbi:biopolymer transport protein TolR [Herbaspirillum sp. Sphag1AN]|uniref:ExbD/TolR family protein n=1 Tax=unclassified Herbaspirillum TaxID=2624150 RepID=UPI001612D4FD|nr:MULTISPECIES: ExbD/TolR family protein [unclassified Herbaspirillum]MBB3211343.1 biopolymer transport protein TolR [Herbaspirillum sp. Sphag1AN]MBB3245390.1 biopolymer transport protein TolR [Herbaspirillum sp. Sphag64]
MAGSSMRGGRARKFKSEINVVPYIDVMLVLLIIFMVAAPVNDPSVINLPTAGKSSVPPSEYIEIALKPDAKATIKITGPKRGDTQTASSRSDLTQRLQAIHSDSPDLPVMISADKEIKYDEVIQIISEAKKLGITRVGLATK